MKHAAIFLITALLTFACTARQESDKNIAPTDTSTAGTTAPDQTTAVALDNTAPAPSATSPASPGGTSLVPSATAGTTVIVTINDGSINVPATPVPPGPVVFTVSNAGKQQHSLHITGNNIDQQLPNPLSAGKGDSLTVTLPAGTYQLVCPILNHADTEKATLTVQP